MGKRLSLILIIAGCVGFVGLFSQSAILILDKSTGSSLPNAHVCFESLDKKNTSYLLSDQNGSLENTSKQKVLDLGFFYWLPDFA